jgi:hypothetical protein
LQRAAELEKEVADLNEGAREHELQMQKAVQELDSARNENATLQTQAQQMLRDAERVSSSLGLGILILGVVQRRPCRCRGEREKNLDCRSPAQNLER